MKKTFLENGRTFSKALSVMLMGAMLVGITGCGVVVETTTQNDTTQVSDDTELEKEEDGQASATIRLQDDYYGAINKETIQSYKINYKDPAAGVVYDMDKAVKKEISDMIMEIVESDKQWEKGSNQWSIRETYKQLMEYINCSSDAVQKDYLAFVKEVNGLEGNENIKKAIGDINNRYGIFDLVVFDINTDLKNSNKNVLYINQNQMYLDYEMKSIYEDNNMRKSIHDQVMDTLVVIAQSTLKMDILLVIIRGIKRRVRDPYENSSMR